MRKEEILKRQKDILLKLKSMMDEQEILAGLREKGKDDVPFDILAVAFTEMGVNDNELLGEYYFYPFDNVESDVMYFVCTMTMTDELNQDTVEELNKALDILNFYLPTGAFLISPDKRTLLYRYENIIDANASLEDNLKIIQINMGDSIQITEKWMDIFLGMDENQISFNDFMTMMP